MLTALLPVILQIVGFIMERIGASIEHKKAFLKLIESLSKDAAVSVRMRAKYQALIERHKLDDEPI